MYAPFAQFFCPDHPDHPDNPIYPDHPDYPDQLVHPDLLPISFSNYALNLKICKLLSLTKVWKILHDSLKILLPKFLNYVLGGKMM